MHLSLCWALGRVMLRAGGTWLGRASRTQLPAWPPALCLMEPLWALVSAFHQKPMIVCVLGQLGTAASSGWRTWRWLSGRVLHAPSLLGPMGDLAGVLNRQHCRHGWVLGHTRWQRGRPDVHKPEHRCHCIMHDAAWWQLSHRPAAVPARHWCPPRGCALPVCCCLLNR